MTKCLLPKIVEENEKLAKIFYFELFLVPKVIRLYLLFVSSLLAGWFIIVIVGASFVFFICTNNNESPDYAERAIE